MLTHPEGFLEARERHYEKFFGRITRPVMHSADVKQVHIDVYEFGPTQGRAYWTLVTSGMSDERQLDPEDCAEGVSPRAEILLYAAKPEAWMFSVLKGLAEMPFEDQTFLHWWHTVPNGMPMTSRPSLLTSFFFLPPCFESHDFTEMKLGGDRVDFLWMIPITEAERRFAAEHGSSELAKKFKDVHLAPVVDESRQSVV